MVNSGDNLGDDHEVILGAKFNTIINAVKRNFCIKTYQSFSYECSAHDVSEQGARIMIVGLSSLAKIDNEIVIDHLGITPKLRETLLQVFNDILGTYFEEFYFIKGQFSGKVVDVNRFKSKYRLCLNGLRIIKKEAEMFEKYKYLKSKKWMY